MNIYQRFVADAYEGGEFSWIQEEEEAEEVGDTLFVFLIGDLSDLSDDDDDDDWEEAIGLVTRAWEQLNEVKISMLTRNDDE